MVYEVKKHYEWDGVNYSVPADIVGKHFEKLEKENGTINRRLVLESAKPKDSPIHDLFEWDDTIAAENYRLTQARLLISNLNVVIEHEKAEPLEIRAYANISETKEGRFINIESAFKSEESKEIVIKRALQELKAFENKYKNLELFGELFNLIDNLIGE